SCLLRGGLPKLPRSTSRDAPREQGCTLAMPTARHWIILAALSGVLLLPTLGASRLWDRDEPRNAGCAAEMLARGDWVVPVFNNELRGHKPVLLYWCMMAVYSVLGVSEFSAR